MKRDAYSWIEDLEHKSQITRLVRLCITGLCGLLLGGYLGFAYVTQWAVPVYSAYANLEWHGAEEAEIPNLANLTSSTVGDPTLLNQLERIRSAELLEPVIAKFELWSDPEFNPLLEPASQLDELKITVGLAAPRTRENEAQLVFETFQEAVDALHIPSTSLVQIVVTTQSAEKSAQLANALADAFAHTHFKLQKQQREQGLAYLHDLVLQSDVELRELGQQLAHLVEYAPVWSPEQLAARKTELELVSLDMERRKTDIATSNMRQYKDHVAKLQADIALIVEHQEKIGLMQKNIEEKAEEKAAFLGALWKTQAHFGSEKPPSTLLSAAKAPLLPSAPNPLIMVVAALLGALMCGSLATLRH